MSALIEFVKAENAKSQAKMDAEPGWIIGMLVEDAAWWAGRGVHTVEDFKRWEMEAVMSDLAKEAYGTRSMCPDTRNMSFKELEAEYNHLCDMAHENFLAEQEAQAQSIVEFEKTIANLISSGAGDRETAIRWLREGEQDEQLLHDDNFFEYCNELPYGYLKQAEAA